MESRGHAPREGRSRHRVAPREGAHRRAGAERGDRRVRAHTNERCRRGGKLCHALAVFTTTTLVIGRDRWQAKLRGLRAHARGTRSAGTMRARRAAGCWPRSGALSHIKCPWRQVLGLHGRRRCSWGGRRRWSYARRRQREVHRQPARGTHCSPQVGQPPLFSDPGRRGRMWSPCNECVTSSVTSASR